MSSVENGEKINANLDDGSFVVVKLGDKYDSGDTVTVILSQVNPLSEGEFEAGFSRGANDTASATFEITAQNSSPFGSVGVSERAGTTADTLVHREQQSLTERPARFG